MSRFVIWSFKKVKRAVVAVLGLTILAIGVAMIFLPGPAIVVVPVGLGILATEFVWARSLLINLKKTAASLKKR
jgi:uncharacterized protein (TIGR02611 family)